MYKFASLHFKPEYDSKIAFTLVIAAGIGKKVKLNSCGTKLLPSS